MTPTVSSPLAQQVAALAAELRAHAAADAGMRAAVAALISACVLRIFALLEDLITLWQSGQLPPLAQASPRRQTAPKSPISGLRTRHAVQRPARQLRPQPARMPAPAQILSAAPRPSQSHPPGPRATAPWRVGASDRGVSCAATRPIGPPRRFFGPVPAPPSHAIFITI